jgi:hypothetical protein
MAATEKNVSDLFRSKWLRVTAGNPLVTGGAAALGVAAASIAARQGVRRSWAVLGAFVLGALLGRLVLTPLARKAAGVQGGGVLG